MKGYLGVFVNDLGKFLLVQDQEKRWAYGSNRCRAGRFFKQSHFSKTVPGPDSVNLHGSASSLSCLLADRYFSVDDQIQGVPGIPLPHDQLSRRMQNLFGNRTDGGQFAHIEAFKYADLLQVQNPLGKVYFFLWFVRTHSHVRRHRNQRSSSHLKDVRISRRDQSLQGFWRHTNRSLPHHQRKRQQIGHPVRFCEKPGNQSRRTPASLWQAEILSSNPEPFFGRHFFEERHQNFSKGLVQKIGQGLDAVGTSA